MSIINIQETEYHGGSLRIFIKEEQSSYGNKLVQSFIKKEDRQGLFKKTYLKFMENIQSRKMLLLKKYLNINLKIIKL